MYCQTFYKGRPPKTAKASLAVFEAVEEETGITPLSVGLYISEGGFRDWHLEMPNGEPVAFDDGLVGHSKHLLPSGCMGRK